MQPRSYHTIDKQGKVGERKLTEFLVRNGQALLPMLELIEQSRMAIDELIDVVGRASIEAVLELSAMQVAGPPQQPSPQRPRRRQGGAGAGLGGLATGHGHGRAQARDSVERRFHAALSTGDPGDGRHGGGVALDGEPANGGSLGGCAEAVAGAPLR